MSMTVAYKATDILINSVTISKFGCGLWRSFAKYSALYIELPSVISVQIIPLSLFTGSVINILLHGVL